MNDDRDTDNGGDEGMTHLRPRVTRKPRIKAEGLHVDLFHVKQLLEELHQVIGAMWRLQAHTMGKWTTEEHLDHEADARQCEDFFSSSVNAPKAGDGR